MLDLSRIRALCFDVDGTLRDTDDQYVDALARRLRRVRFLFPAGDPAPFAHRVVMALESPGTFLYGLPDRPGIDLHLAALGDAIERRLPPRSARHSGCAGRPRSRRADHGGVVRVWRREGAAARRRRCHPGQHSGSAGAAPARLLKPAPRRAHASARARCPCRAG